ncbi:MAG: MBL fold metallo-hydrolase [Patescibacteria group bacterium]
MRNFIEKNKKYIVSIATLFLFTANIIIWSEVFKKEHESDIQASIFNVGQGDSIFINSRDGAQILIDGGPNSKVLSMLKDRMPYYDNSIDVVIATHPHKDHISGLIDVFKRYDVTTFIESGAKYNTSEYYELEKLIQNSGARRIMLGKPARLLFYNNAQLKLLTPTASFDNTALKNVHDADIVSELDFQGRRILLMGDAEKNLEKQLISSNLLTFVDVLKVGHHGSKTSSIAEFLSVINPKYSIISVGKNNYGHPNQNVLDRLTSIGSYILRTDIVGTIDINIKNGVLQVRAEK